MRLGISERAAVTVVLAAGGYPAEGDVGNPIEGLPEDESEETIVFHAGTALRDGRVITNGGRILNVTAVGDALADARARAYRAVERISFPGMRYRTDVAAAVAHV